MVILRDFNVDLLNANQASKHKLVKTLHNLHLTQRVKDVTRPASGKCLDHIWTSHLERMMFVQTKNIGMLDHLPTMAVRRCKGEALLSENSNSSNTVSYSDLKRLDVQKFVDEWRDAPWEAAFVLEDTDDIVDSWYKIFFDVLDSQVPVKQKRVKNSARPKWFTTEIGDHIKKNYSLKFLRGIFTKPCTTIWESMTFYVICGLVFGDLIPLRQPSFV